MKINFRAMTTADWEQVAAIYEQGIATGNATFQEYAPSREDWDKGHLPQCRIVAVADGLITGWAALTAVSAREVYAGVAEVSVYVGAAFRGQGIGLQLLTALIGASEAAGFWTLQAGIFPENIASVRMHTSLGFREVGFREHIGKMQGRWRNTVLLERRSKIVGLQEHNK